MTQHYLSEQAKEFPVLPEPDGYDTQLRQDTYNADSMQEYGDQRAAHAREVALSEAMQVAKTTCHHETTPFADGFNMAALNIEVAIEALKGK